MAGFVDYLLRTEHLLIMLGVWALIGAVRRCFPQLEDNRRWVRSLPALPIVLCSLAVWVPGLIEGGIGQRLLLGLVLGSSCGHAHKLLKTSIFGNHRRIRDRPSRL